MEIMTYPSNIREKKYFQIDQTYFSSRTKLTYYCAKIDGSYFWLKLIDKADMTLTIEEDSFITYVLFATTQEVPPWMTK